MRELIIKRIGAMFQMSPPIKDNNYLSRWGRFWYTPSFERFGGPTNKEIGTHKLVHVSEIDLNTVPDENLVFMFEDIVRQFNKQM